MLSGNTPILILKEGTERSTGKSATANNIAAAKAIGDAVRSTLGPKGMDKMLVDSMGDVVLTNDGVTILKEIEVEHPAAKMLVEVAKTQDEECGDGTTTAVILSGELLSKAQVLLDAGVHATAITNGFRIAADEANRILTRISREVRRNDSNMLANIAATAMTGKTAETNKEFLADLAVRAVRAVAEREGRNVVVDRKNIKMEKKHGAAITNSELVEGIIVDKEPVHSGMPRSIKDAKIALVNSALEVKKTEIDAKIQITDPTQINAFLAQEEDTIRNLVENVTKSGANVLVCQKGIDDLAQHYLAKAGVLAIRRAKKSDMEALERATGGRIVTNLDDLSEEDLGWSGLVECRRIADDDMTFITKCRNPKSVSLLIRGGTEHVVDEIERSLNDAIGVVRLAVEDGRVLIGGGAPEVELALRLRKFAPKVGGREQLAIEAFADSVEIVPKTLAENAGLDVINTLVNLRNSHTGRNPKRTSGIDVFSGKIVNMQTRKVLEPLRVKTQAINSATEVANMVLRIDDVIASKGMSEGAGMPPGGMPPGGMGGMGGMDGMY